jgi:hypothetical protein
MGQQRMPVRLPVGPSVAVPGGNRLSGLAGHLAPSRIDPTRFYDAGADQSLCNTTAGSTRPARQAGSQLAMTAVRRITPAEEA